MHPGQLLMLIIGFQDDQNIKDSLINRVSTVYATLVKPAFSHSYFCYKFTEAKIISTVKSYCVLPELPSCKGYCLLNFLVYGGGGGWEGEF